MEEIPSLIIRNGTVIDGSGSQRYEADIEITGSKITHIGEVDPSYSLYKQNLLKIKRNFNKSPCFIFIVRKPIDRAYSHYLMSKLRGYEKLSFNDSLNKEKERIANDDSEFSLINNGYFERSLYYKYIEFFYDVYNNVCRCF